MRWFLKWAFIFAVCVLVVEPALSRVLGPTYARAKAALGAWTSRATRELRLPAQPPARSRRPTQKLEVPEGLDPLSGRRTAVETAESLLGTPYVYGGAAPGGIDCSGLVAYAYRSAGVGLPRTASRQYRVGKKISLSALELGDLVFFKGPRGPAGHVGIYLGDGNVIHASSGRGRVVVDPIETVASANGLTGARRLLELPPAVASAK